MKKLIEGKEHLWVTLFYIGVGAISRLLPHPQNVTPIAAMALLGGAYLSLGQALILPLLAMAFSDVFLGFSMQFPFVYASFLATALIGQALRENRSAGRVLGACLASSVLFFIVTNAGTWLTLNLYTHDVKGLAACYIAAIPFFRNEILGNLFFTAILFSLEHVSLGWLQQEAKAVA